MKNRNLINYSTIMLKIALVLTITSCSSIKNVKYFTDIPDSGKVIKITAVKFVEPTIQPDDILSVNLQTLDPNAAQILALGNVSSSAVGNTTTGSTGSQTVTGYLVDRDGMIELPSIGKIHVGDLTTNQAKELIREKASEQYKNFSINIRFANFKITILGEVTKPGTYVVSTEKVNILDALGLAGDLTIYGKRENVLLIRHYPDGTQEEVRLDLTKSNILKSPYYYLRQNDYIYVEPIKTKVVASDAVQSRNVNVITAITGALISLLAILISTGRI
jgi:polysaccharide export outer membrane protein